MTVGVGAICEDGRSAVIAADKMVTFGAPMSMQTETPDFNKIQRLTDRIVLVFSGSVPDGEEIVSHVRPQVAGLQKPSVGQVGEAVKMAYIGLKRKRVEEAILRPFIGADFQQFQTLIAQASSSQVLQQILGLILQHNLNLDLLIAGTDDSGTHLYIASHPGQLLPMNTTGYTAIGSGGLHAAVRMSLVRHSRLAPLIETVYNVYDAKKAAEVAPGVGKLTDLALIREGQICELMRLFLRCLIALERKNPNYRRRITTLFKAPVMIVLEKMPPNYEWPSIPIGFGEQGLALLTLWKAGNEWAAITNTLGPPAPIEEPKKPSDD